jgi:hypothetical protein
MCGHVSVYDTIEEREREREREKVRKRKRETLKKTNVTMVLSK